MSFLPGMFPGAAGTVSFPTIEDFTTQVDLTGVSTYTFSGVTVTQAGLLVVRWLLTGNFNANRTVNTVTVNGNSATVIQQNVGFVSLSTNSACGLAQISVAAGATGNIVLTVSGGNGLNCSIRPLCIVGLSSTTKFASNGTSASPGTSVSTTLNMPGGGVIVVAAGGVGSGNDMTATGWNNEAETDAGIYRSHFGFDTRVATETGRTIASAGSGNNARAIACASWR